MSDKKIFYKKLFTLVLPIAFQNFMTAAVSASDAIMLGVISQEALSAVSLAGQIQFVLSLFLAALTIGTTILAAQYWGKGDKVSVEKILAIVLKFSSIISLVFFLGTLFIPETLMRIFTPDADLISQGVQYLRIVGVSYLLMGISQIYLCIMKNSGYTLKSTVIGSVSVVTNIVLNAVFIFGVWKIPAMGIAGAALATVLSRVLELIWAFLESLRRDRIKLHLKYEIHAERDLRRDFFH